MSGFSDPILTGDGTLIRANEKSVNYVTGTSGWQISRDGDAEFNNVTARGTLEVGAAGGPQVVVNAGTYGHILFPTGSSVENQEAEIASASFGRDTPTERLSLQANGPQVTGNAGAVNIRLDSAKDDGSELEQFVVNSTVAGDVLTVGRGTVAVNGVDATPTDWATYTPTVTGGGTATFTTRTGYHRSLGAKTRLFVAYLVVNAAGSGATAVSFTLPTTPDRTIRQIFSVFFETTAPLFATGNAVVFTSGSGTTVDRVRVQDGGAVDDTSNLTGARLTAGAILTIQGWYREV